MLLSLHFLTCFGSVFYYHKKNELTLKMIHIFKVINGSINNRLSNVSLLQMLMLKLYFS